MSGYVAMQFTAACLIFIRTYIVSSLLHTFSRCSRVNISSCHYGLKERMRHSTTRCCRDNCSPSRLHERRQHERKEQLFCHELIIIRPEINASSVRHVSRNNTRSQDRTSSICALSHTHKTGSERHDL